MNNKDNSPSALKRWIYKIIAVLSLGMAVLGILLPGLPATEFIMLAAWAAAKGSPTIHHWIMSVPYFKNIIDNWRNGGMISRANKIQSAISMLCCLGVLIIMHVPVKLILLAAVGMSIGAFFIWRRPEHASLVSDKVL
ncbi:YbaN family protein [Vibrio eleionomae]|nr:YbaN family protein [Vibrio eleionomae]